MNDVVGLGRARPLREDNESLTVTLANGRQVVVPKNCIDDESECFSMKSGAGIIVVTREFAEKEGLIGVLKDKKT